MASEDASVSFKKRSKRSRSSRKRPRVRDEVEEDEERRLHAVQDRQVKEVKKRKVTEEKQIRKGRDEKNDLPDEKKEENDDGSEEERERVTKWKQKKSFGPKAAPKHIKTSISVDYQPDVCKDYKETGYCGFGDACKFLHDRTNYQSGWQVKKDWQTRQKERREALLRGEDPDAEDEKVVEQDDDGLPFACHICRKEFTRPVVTLCGHYFCEGCALKRMEKDPTCAICQHPLRGILNVAHKIVQKSKERNTLQRENED